MAAVRGRRPAGSFTEPAGRGGEREALSGASLRIKRPRVSLPSGTPAEFDRIPRRLTMLSSVSEAGDLRVEASGQAKCWLCGRPTYDPDKRDRPWARAVSQSRQVLVCPVCQTERPDWAEDLDRCRSCGATRLSVMLGEVVCRACGHVQSEESPELTTGA
jgi:ribosomal protein L37E